MHPHWSDAQIDSRIKKLWQSTNKPASSVGVGSSIARESNIPSQGMRMEAEGVSNQNDPTKKKLAFSNTKRISQQMPQEPQGDMLDELYSQEDKNESDKSVTGTPDRKKSKKIKKILTK